MLLPAVVAPRALVAVLLSSNPAIREKDARLRSAGGLFGGSSGFKLGAVQ